MNVARALCISVAAVAVGVAAAIPSAADPDLATESAAEVITELREQGYAVEVKGVSSPDAAMLSACKVTSIQDSGIPTADPTTTTTVYVEVACPIQHS